MSLYESGERHPFWADTDPHSGTRLASWGASVQRKSVRHSGWARPQARHLDLSSHFASQLGSIMQLRNGITILVAQKASRWGHLESRGEREVN